MAIRKATSDLEKGEGRWIEFDYDEELKLPVSILVRRMNDSDQRAGENKFGKLVVDKRTRTKVMRIPRKFSTEANYYRMARCWLDCKNWHQEMGDEQSAQFFSEQLKQELSAGDVVQLDGRMTIPIKVFLIKSETALFVRINEEALSLEGGEGYSEEEEERDLAGNSQGSSSSPSEPTE